VTYDTPRNAPLYLQCKGGSRSADAAWEVKRRYSEFEELHQKTEAEVPSHSTR
jgi:hypothetical protein